MRFSVVIILFITMNSCKAQEYKFQFSDKEDKIVFTLKKNIDNDQQCFTFSKEEQDTIRKHNLNQGELVIYEKNDSVLKKFSITDVFTSKTFEDKVLLCELDGKLKFDEPLCIENE